MKLIDEVLGFLNNYGFSPFISQLTLKTEDGAPKDTVWILQQRSCDYVCGNMLRRIDEWMIPSPATPAQYQKWTIVFVRFNRIGKKKEKQSDKSVVQ
uniref:Uncharacterized protein n=1 Tax=Tanacetum cinerariifolium TaxID=118510 RepID=A0A6L2J570_TANCI|nr:hypothetical protein [Tanacetum cinerariifolium]